MSRFFTLHENFRRLNDFSLFHDAIIRIRSDPNKKRQRAVEVRFYCNPKLADGGIITEISEPGPCEYQLNVCSVKLVFVVKCMVSVFFIVLF
jgi:hypothetical protein